MIFDLKKLNLKNTKGRQAVFEIIKKSSKPVPASEIVGALKMKNVDLDEATVYRILDLFFERGIVKRILTPRSTQAKYELGGDDHHHFTCDYCGDIQNIKQCNVDALVKDLVIKKHVLIKGHSLEFFGLCANCH